MIGCLLSFRAALPKIPLQPTATAIELPTPTPIPHILSTPAANTPGVFYEDFSSNANHWDGDYWQTPGIEVKNGKMHLQAPGKDTILWASCGSCFIPRGPYYLQADFATDSAPDAIFGLLIKLRSVGGNFFLFGINPESDRYYFFNHVGGVWGLRSAAVSDQIRTFPASNTLGIYVASGSVELYINGRMVDTYQDSEAEFESGLIGLYTEGSAFGLQVDNLIAERLGGQ
jgi:hypothetical protein